MLYGYTSDEVGKAAIEEWQSKVPAEWGSSYQGERIDGPLGIWFHNLTITSVAVVSWAQKQEVEEGDVIMSINGKDFLEFRHHPKV